MNLSVKQEMCFFYHPSSGKDLLINMGHTRLYTKRLNIGVSSYSGAMQVALSGYLGSSNIEKLDEFLLEYRYHFKRYETIVFDISQLDTINQLGVRGLVDLVCVLKQEGLEVSFQRGGNKADQVLTESGFFEWLQNK
ncbi:STAS domain-containing protein [Rossellomorea sp. NS-SX7]|uniref:STAS domain-containing protein n=1 Tax=Rossellomorea sp. NS-SX7 TaxID=3463856 RepID=UPI00405888E1